jgi:DNA-directed RNA polymerase subunit alpha
VLTIRRPKLTVPEDLNRDLPATRRKFQIDDLPSGFGYTIGNSLRRTLLSSVPGAAITRVQIHGVNHEFATVPGVQEDVIGLLLNMKDVVLQSFSDEPVEIRLEKRGPATVVAGDFECPPEVEIINKDHVIAHVSKSGRLEITATVQRGYGYVTAEQNKVEGAPIGVIPVDSLYSPVRRVTYKVDQTMERDSVVIDVETNGAIAPAEAVSSAARTLVNLLDVVAEAVEAPALEIGEAFVEKPTSPDLERPIEALDLSERPRNCLKRAQIFTIGELVEKTEQELMAIQNFGQKSLDEVKQKLDEMGLSLASSGAADLEEADFLSESDVGEEVLGASDISDESEE